MTINEAHWKRLAHFTYLVKEIQYEMPRISAAVEWASACGAPTDALRVHISDYQKRMACVITEINEINSYISTGKRPLIDGEESDYSPDEILECAISTINDMIAFRSMFISNVAEIITKQTE